MASVRTRSFSHPLPGDWIMSNLQRIGRDAAAPIQICLASTTLTAMLARRGQLEVVVMPPAAWPAREIELQALATLAALAQISTPSAAHFLKSHQLLVQKFAADRDRQRSSFETRHYQRAGFSFWRSRQFRYMSGAEPNVTFQVRLKVRPETSRVSRCPTQAPSS